jgi:AraC-like DNA-binding protein
MFFQTQRPSPPLEDYVGYYWYLSDFPGHEREHIVPSGTLEIVFNLLEDEIRVYDPSDSRRFTRYRGALVSGAYRSHFVIDTRAHGAIFGIHFKAGGASALLGVPPGSLADSHVNLEAIWGACAAELRERLCAARDLPDRCRILDGALMRRLGSAVRQREEVKFALRRLRRADARIGEVAAEVDLSHRRLIELFTEEVGVTPKVFSRVQRFQRTLTLARQSGASPDWAQTALACGYFDQSHLVREFVALSGLSPTELVRSRADVKDNHAAVDGRHR